MVQAGARPASVQVRPLPTRATCSRGTQQSGRSMPQPELQSGVSTFLASGSEAESTSATALYTSRSAMDTSTTSTSTLASKSQTCTLAERCPSIQQLQPTSTETSC